MSPSVIVMVLFLLGFNFLTDCAYWIVGNLIFLSGVCLFLRIGVIACCYPIPELFVFLVFVSVDHEFLYIISSHGSSLNQSA